MKQLLRVTAIGILLSACGSSGPNLGPETAPTPTQQSAVVSTAQDIAALSMANLQGEAAGAAAIDLAFTAQLLILNNNTAARSTPGLGGVAQAVTRAAVGPGQVEPSGCEVIGDTSIVWNQCTDTDGATINGMLSWGPGQVSVDLHVTASSQGVTFDYTANGSMTFSDTEIQGDVTVSFTLSGGGTTASETLRTQIDVQLMASCIIGGTLTVTETGTGNGSHSGAVQIVWTGCNAFRVRNG